MTKIMAVRSALPQYRYAQAEFTTKVAELVGLSTAQRALLARLHANSGVETRHTVLPLSEYGELSGIGPSNDRYIDEAADLGERALSEALKMSGLTGADLDLLIVTSVTGVAVPSLDARLIPRLGLRSDVKRLPIFGLGCVAGAAALSRLHDYLLGWPGHRAALLAVEVCSLTWPTMKVTTADLVVSGLFGDGAAALVATGDGVASGDWVATGDGVASGDMVGLPRVVATRSEVYPDSVDTLGWRLGSEGFRIVLTADLAEVVERRLSDTVTAFLADWGLTVADIGVWVCHPGGPKVIDAVQNSLGLSDDAVALSRRSLAEVGNLSSVSVLHVLEQTIDTCSPAPGSIGLMIGLGPGVSAELVLMQW
jgi:alkylresorcinol/alkylpyrone synthase